MMKFQLHNSLFYLWVVITIGLSVAFSSPFVQPAQAGVSFMLGQDASTWKPADITCQSGNPIIQNDQNFRIENGLFYSDFRWHIKEQTSINTTYNLQNLDQNSNWQTVVYDSASNYYGYKERGDSGIEILRTQSIPSCQTPTPFKRFNFIALGDSFISGEGDNQEGFDVGYDVARNKTFRNCHISYTAWPYRVSKDSNLNLKLISFPACSGAETKDILKGSPDQPKQIDQVYPSDVIAISIGGNDVGFLNMIYACVLIDCKTVQRTILQKIDNLPKDLTKVYDALRKKTGNDTDIYVVGYPYVLPNYKCSTANFGVDAFATLFKSYGSLGTHVAFQILKDADISYGDVKKNIAARAFTFSESEALVAKNVTDTLNEKIKQTVNARNDKRLHFVEVNYSGSPFENHTLCTPDPYFNSIFIDFFNLSSAWGNKNMSFHPNHKGTAAYKQVFADYYLKNPHK